MTVKVITLRLPDELLVRIEDAAQREDRSRSEFICEALRQYVAEASRRIPVGDAKSWWMLQ